jgi:hypothetical protein
MKAPTTNIQAPEKHQAPNSNPDCRLSPVLELGAWSLSGAWMLVLGVLHSAVE